MGVNWAEHTVEIAAPAEECFEAITDYESFPRWQSAVIECEVVDRHRKGLGKTVKFVVDGKVRKIHYTLRYDYDRPEKITWEFLEGKGIKEIRGDYTFEPRGDVTMATYRVGADPGGGVPGPVAKRVNKQLVKRSVEELREETERRAGKPGGRAGGDDLLGTAVGVATAPARLGLRLAGRTAGTALGVARRVAERAPLPGLPGREERTEEHERPERD